MDTKSFILLFLGFGFDEKRGKIGLFRNPAPKYPYLIVVIKRYGVTNSE